MVKKTKTKHLSHVVKYSDMSVRLFCEEFEKEYLRLKDDGVSYYHDSIHATIRQCTINVFSNSKLKMPSFRTTEKWLLAEGLLPIERSILGKMKAEQYNSVLLDQLKVLTESKDRESRTKDIVSIVDRLQSNLHKPDAGSSDKTPTITINNAPQAPDLTEAARFLNIPVIDVEAE